MKKILILGEKREAIEQMSKHLGDATIKKKSGYMEGDKYILSWAMGHMYILELPERVSPKYGLWKKLSNSSEYIMEDLINVPLVADNDPSRYHEKYKKSQHDFAKIKGNQLSKINTILKRKDIEEIILAPDADAEGERIGQDLVIQNYKLMPHLKEIITTRFWNTGSFKSKTAVEKAMKERKPITNEKYKNLYNSALARLLSDYLIGMKLTKTLSEKYNAMISSGRIQSVLLSLVVNREKEINNFKPKEYWKINGIYNDLTLNHYYIAEEIDDFGKSKKVEKTTYMVKEDLDQVINECKEKKLNGIITKCEEKTTKSQKPKLMNTGDFQSKYMDKFNGTLDMADLVLEYLRDEGYTTYPRTDGHYFSIADKDEVLTSYNTIKKLYGKTGKINNLLDFSIENSIFNDKIAAKQNHTPLSITEKIPTKETLKKWENAVYKKQNLKKVKESYLYILNILTAQFMPDDKVLKQKIELEINKHKFKKEGKKIIENGWRDILVEFFPDTTFNLSLKKGDTLQLTDITTKSDYTKVPPKYTKKTLLKTMINVNRALDEEISGIQDIELRKKRIAEVKKAKKIFKTIEGIGTNATRKSIIQILEKRKVIEVKGKKEEITVTKSGFFVDDKNPKTVKKLDTTAIWEESLDAIRQGKLDYKEFVKSVDLSLMEDMIPNILERTSENINIHQVNSIKKNENSLGLCPVCKTGDILENSKSYYCVNWRTGCKYSIWKNTLDKFNGKLTKNNVIELLKTGESKIELKGKTKKIIIENKYGIKIIF